MEIEADEPNDAFLHAIAIAGDADYLLTGDRYFLQFRNSKLHIKAALDYGSRQYTIFVKPFAEYNFISPPTTTLFLNMMICGK